MLKWITGRSAPKKLSREAVRASAQALASTKTTKKEKLQPKNKHTAVTSKQKEKLQPKNKDIAVLSEKKQKPQSKVKKAKPEPQEAPVAEALNIVSIRGAIKKKKAPVVRKRVGSEGLVIKNLGKSYSGKPVVRDINLELSRGEAIGLLGPNGAGKTTSFYMIMGLIRPDYGHVVLDGKHVTQLPVYRRARMGIGYLPQEASVFRGLSVEDNILSILELSEPIADQRKQRLEELLAEFSISHLRLTPALALSGGERRRVEIARALASNPSFILLDEPLAGVDPVAVADIKELIIHLKDRNIGVLITDHNVRDALDIIDRAYIIHGGKVLMEGTPEEIVENEEVRRVYLGEGFSWQ